MLDKLTAAESRYDQLMAEMADPAVQADTVKFRTHSKELADMQPLIDHFRQYKDVAAQVAELKGLSVEAVAEATSRNFERLFDRVTTA